MFLTDE